MAIHGIHRLSRMDGLQSWGAACLVSLSSAGMWAARGNSLQRSILACRRCHKLVYACQRESDNHGSIRGADGIRRRLGWKPGIANPEGDKPKGMHRRTFERLKARHDAFADTSWDWMAQRLKVLERRLSDRGINLDNPDCDD